MTVIEVDLSDYKEEVKYTFCENNCILGKYAPVFFKEVFIDYVNNLEKRVIAYNEKLNANEILEKLKDFKTILER